jgi:3alpha(or 20beta)-hydroxysteroid dehydrogenase
VLLADVLEDDLRAGAERLGDLAVAAVLDVRDPAQWHDAVVAAEREFGAVTVLVNNAAIFRAGGVVDTTPDAYMDVVAVNQLGCLLGMQAVVPSMQRAGGGSIVNISSTAGMWGVPFAADYTASKFGVRGLTKVAALELGRDGIRVNSVHPGGVLTEMVKAVGDDGESDYYRKLPAGRIGSVDDIANLVLFLASDESAYCTGTEFVIDGGMQAGDLQLMPRPRR